jgi:hypothetical protein
VSPLRGVGFGACIPWLAHGATLLRGSDRSVRSLRRTLGFGLSWSGWRRLGGRPRQSGLFGSIACGLRRSLGPGIRLLIWLAVLLLRPGLELPEQGIAVCSGISRLRLGGLRLDKLRRCGRGRLVARHFRFG